ncbi:unnamed protein product [Pieris macdunnoughi]|nr:unnamed protein product [Pieris macdunnoughi]
MDDSEVANIDVAGLIQTADDDGLNNRFEVADDSRDYLSNNNFDSLVEANLEEYQGNEDYSNKDTHDDGLFDEKPQSYRNDRSLATNEKEIQRYDNFNTQNNYKNLQKKCVFKNMKIPFFSHEKRKTTRPKNKKRKLFNFASKKLKGKASKVTTPLSLTTQRSTESTLFKLNKRSYLERVCPICRRKFIARRVKSYEQSTSLIHNSRQFYNRNPYNIEHQGNYNKISKSEDEEPEQTMRDPTLSSELSPEDNYLRDS